MMVWTAMRAIAVFPEVRAPRWGKEESEYTLAKKHVPYVFSTSTGAALIHKINYVRLRWWTCGPGGKYLVRLATPRMGAVANCGAFFFLNSARAKMCITPRPDAVLCAMCHGKGRNFPRGGQHEVPRELAKIRKGCIMEAT